ncbi:MAG TPA: hypothetical protein VMD99_04035 [Terriglobales bacterium]|nr:hypothetical protein [Terriglobales bacterium]
MTTRFKQRLGKLENQLGVGPESKQILYFIRRSGVRLALDRDTCIQIPREGEFLPTGPIGFVNFLDIPEGLNAQELERFLREQGEETRWMK